MSAADDDENTQGKAQEKVVPEWMLAAKNADSQTQGRPPANATTENVNTGSKKKAQSVGVPELTGILRGLGVATGSFQSDDLPTRKKNSKSSNENRSIRSDKETAAVPVPKQKPAKQLSRESEMSDSGAAASTAAVPLEVQDYYHGLLPRNSVAEVLRKNGDFLVRATEVKGKRCYVLSALWKKEHVHVVLQQTASGFWHIKMDNCFQCIPDLILYYTKTKEPIGNQKFILLKPVSHQSWQLNNDQITLGKTLGHGAFGEVFFGTLVLHQNDPPATVAVKTLKGVINDKEKRAAFIAEARTMREYTHPNIVRLIGVATQKEPVMIVMEFCPNGSLRAHLKKQAKLKVKILPSDRRRFCLEAAEGLAYLEKKHCVHRDVAARNCLLDPGLHVKISDFGLSVKVEAGEERMDKKARPLPVKWLAPETLTDMKYSHKSDVWAYGVLVYEVYADGSEPYKGLTNAEVRRKVTMDAFRLVLPPGAPEAMAALVADCWASKPEHRPSFKHLVHAIKQIKLNVVSAPSIKRL